MSAQAFVPCFKCGKTLENAFPDSDNQPSDGTEFSTHGHYGSTFWDSMDGEVLVLNVCDECLAAQTDRLATRKCVKRQVAVYEMNHFDARKANP